MSELLPIIGSLGSFAVAVWIWKFARIAIIFKIFAVAVGGIIGLSVLGILSIQVHPERVVELVTMLIDAIGGLL